MVSPRFDCIDKSLILGPDHEYEPNRTVYHPRQCQEEPRADPLSRGLRDIREPPGEPEGILAWMMSWHLGSRAM